MTKQVANKKGKRKPNPLSNVARISRPRLSFNGQVLNAFTISTLSQSGANGAVANTWRVDCSGAGLSVASSQAVLMSFYKEYSFISLKAEWLPTIGPASNLAGSNVYITYLDNPEQMAVYAAGTPTDNINRQLADASTKIFNAWERVTVNIPLTHRRKTFDVNGNNDGTVDVLDRSTQGMVVTGANTSVVESSIGRWKFTYQVRLTGLSLVST